MPERPLPRVTLLRLASRFKFSVNIFRASCPSRIINALGDGASLRHFKTT